MCWLVFNHNIKKITNYPFIHLFGLGLELDITKFDLVTKTNYNSYLPMDSVPVSTTPPIPPPSSPDGDLYSMEVPRMETRLMKKKRIIAENFWRSLMEGLDRPPYNLPPTSS